MPPLPPALGNVCKSPGGGSVVIAPIRLPPQGQPSPQPSEPSTPADIATTPVTDPMLMSKSQPFDPKFYIHRFFLHAKSSKFHPDKNYAGLVFYGALSNEDAIAEAQQKEQEQEEKALQQLAAMGLLPPPLLPPHGTCNAIDDGIDDDITDDCPPSLMGFSIDLEEIFPPPPVYSLKTSNYNKDTGEYEGTILLPGAVFLYDSSLLPTHTQLAANNVNTDGRVHGPLFFQLTSSTFEYERSKYDKILFEGFSFHNGEEKFNSRFFNQESTPDYHDTNITMCEVMRSIVHDLIELWKEWNGKTDECPQVCLESQTLAPTMGLLDLSPYTPQPV